MTWTKIMSAAGAAVALSAAAAPAMAAENRIDYAITISGTSDYIFRGISLNDENPAFQPSIELTYNIFYIGAWGTNIADAFSPWETDFYLGIRPETGPISWDIGVVYYTFFGAEDPVTNDSIASDVDYVELYLGASITPREGFTLGLMGYFTPDQGISYPETGTIEGSISHALPQVGVFSPSISALIGFTSAASNTGFFLGEDEYVYWNAGIGVEIEKFSLDFRYWDTDISGGGFGFADERFVFTAGVALP